MKAKSKSKRKRALNGTFTAEHTVAEHIKHSALQTGKDMLIGVIGGGIVGAVIGKPALLIGIGVTGYGHFAHKPALTTFGVGMMASGGFGNGINGVDGFTTEDVKARIMNFKDSISSRLFLDKIIKKDPAEKTATTEKTETTNGVGAIQYFPDNKELDFSALENLEKQIAKSGEDYQKTIKGTNEENTVEGSYAEALDLSNPSY